jgi:hypothetical protein
MLGAFPGFAQVPTPPDPADVRVRIGPLWLNPVLALTNAGIDNNVFNEADTDNPKSDFTMTVTPRTDVWLRMGRTWVTTIIREDIVWYKEFASQRSVNHSYSLAWIVPLTRVAFTVGGAYVNTRERPGFEIDARSQRQEKAINGAAEIRVLSKTLFGVRGERRNVEFDKDAVFLGNNLHDELTRTSTNAALTIRHELTPLTNVTIELGREQDRFEFSSLRDSDSTRLTVGLNFDRFALINGVAQFGYRAFTPLAPDLPGYSGTTARVDLAYVALGATRLAVQAGRDVQYSFDVNQPYYLQTGISGSIAQQIYGPVDVEGRIGAQRLAYQTRTGAVVEVSDRVDRIRSYGAGIGYRLGRDLRLGFNVDQQKRTSDIDLRQYDGRRYGMSVTYGL